MPNSSLSSSSSSAANTHLSLKRLCSAALFAALIFVATAYLPRIPTLNGYVHLGDTFIFLCASLLPMPYAVTSAAIGGALADLLTGYPVWALASFIIKGLTALPFTSHGKRILCPRNFIALAFAAIFCMGGYYLWNALVIANNWVAPLSEIPMNFMQTAVSAILYIGIALVFDHTPALSRFFRS